MSLNLTMPEEDLKLLKKFVELSEEEQNFILEQLKNLKPEEKADTIEKISENTKLDESESKDILSFIINFYFNYYTFGSSKEEFIDMAVHNSTKKSGIDIKITQKTEDILKKILDMENTVGISSKSEFLIRENPNLIFKTRIITDLRPIYYSDPKKKPEYGIIKHTLKLSYLENKRLNNIFFTLELDNLLELKSLIERAIEKHKSLQNLCESSKLKILMEDKE